MKLIPRLRSFAFSVACAGFASVASRAELEKPQAEVDRQNNIILNGKDLLYRGDFKEIERLAVEYLDKQQRHPAGVWKLRHFADAITHPKNPADPKEWDLVFGKLEQWNRESKSPFSLSMLGKAYLNYGKEARGDGLAAGVPKDQWPKIEERVAKAVETLLAAKKANPKDPEVYRNLLHAGILQGWPRKRMDGVMKEAIVVAPDYFDCYYNISYYLMERWYGEEGDWQRFANSLPERIEGDDAYIVYTRLAAQMFLWYQEDFFAEDRPDKISWTKMKRGYEATMKKYPDSSMNLNRFAYFAWLAKDRETAREKLKILDDGQLVFELAWDGKDRVEAARKWIAEKDDK